MKYKRIHIKTFKTKVKRFEGGIGIAALDLIQGASFYLLPTIKILIGEYHGEIEFCFLFWRLELVDEATIFTLELGGSQYEAELHKIEQ